MQGTLSSDSLPSRIAGVDLAWMSENNGSGIAIGSLDKNSLRVERVVHGLKGCNNVCGLLESVTNLRGVAIDAPLIINNATGRRPCEGELGSVYSSRWAGCHPANRALYPDAASVTLSRALEKRGFLHLGEPASEKWQFECYPHPAIIEIFRLDKRLAYKKGSVAARRAGQIELAKHIRSLQTVEGLALIPNADVDILTDASQIVSLRGQRLKDNEDGLDAIVCLYIAGLYAAGAPARCFGDRASGYIWVPA